MLILEDIYFVMESDSFKFLRNLLFYAGQSSLIIAHEKKNVFGCYKKGIWA